VQAETRDAEESGAWENETLEGESGTLELMERPIRCMPVKVGGLDLTEWTRLREYTTADPEMKELVGHLKDPIGKPMVDKATQKLKEDFEMEEGVLYFTKGKEGNRERDQWRIWVPKALRATLMTLIHSMPMGGHMGRDRMEKIMGTRFYWKGCAKEVREFVQI